MFLKFTVFLQREKTEKRKNERWRGSSEGRTDRGKGKAALGLSEEHVGEGVTFLALFGRLATDKLVEEGYKQNC